MAAQAGRKERAGSAYCAKTALVTFCYCCGTAFPLLDGGPDKYSFPHHFSGPGTQQHPAASSCQTPSGWGLQTQLRWGLLPSGAGPLGALAGVSLRWGSVLSSVCRAPTVPGHMGPCHST